MVAVLAAAAVCLAQAGVVAAFLVARDRQEQRHVALLAGIEAARAGEREQWAYERRELLQRIQAPTEATVQYAPYEPPEGPQHISITDDEALMEAMNG